MILPYLFILFGLLLSPQVPALPIIEPQISSYIWHAENLETHLNDYMQFSLDNDISILYVQQSTNIKPDIYSNFIEAAHDKGIKVYLLDGAPEWATNDGRHELDSKLDWLKDYQDKATNQGRFDGLHLDIEYYLLDLSGRREERALKRYMGHLEDAKTFCLENDLEFGSSIPFWYDSVEMPDDAQYANLAEWHIHTVPYTVIMAYRNEAFGKNSITALIEKELTYAKAADHKIIIALETRESNEGDHISFFGSSKSDFENMLTNLSHYYSKESAFQGFAIHHLDSWIDLYDN